MKIEFVCRDKNVAETFPPVPAKKLIPEWYKNIPHYVSGKKVCAFDMKDEPPDSTPGLSIKACMPFMDYLSSGYIIRHSADIALSVLPVDEHNSNPWYWRTKYIEGITGCQLHAHEQLPVAINGVNHTYIKILSPWVIKTPPGYSCYFYQPLDFDSPLQLFSGVVDTDTYDGVVNFPGIVRKEGDHILEGGSPLMVVFPFKRDEWEMEISTDEVMRPSKVFMFLERGYKKLFHKPKKYE